VGPKTVATFIGEVGDVARFKQAKELRALYLKKISQGKKSKQVLICVGKNWPVLCAVCSKTNLL